MMKKSLIFGAFIGGAAAVAASLAVPVLPAMIIGAGVMAVASTVCAAVTSAPAYSYEAEIAYYEQRRQPQPTMAYERWAKRQAQLQAADVCTPSRYEPLTMRTAQPVTRWIADCAPMPPVPELTCWPRQVDDEPSPAPRRTAPPPAVEPELPILVPDWPRRVEVQPKQPPR